ncbi:MAG TPA: urate hydroxylase PuuD [Planctomycetota bacterium]|jgi:uncharacterized membrane protein|nr:urate hydroxylase PuuD [Planctomycetota bacterium]
MDWAKFFELILRWLHVFAGIVWIGHLYFFNFVNVPFQGTMDKDTKRKVNPALLPRALWWFRWGAMITFLAGLGLFVLLYLHQGLLTDSFGDVSDRAMWILFGMLLGSVMWFNVWFVIWPAQKKLIAWTRDGLAPPEQPALAKRALLASRANSYLSGPMLFGMLAGAAHYPSMQFPAFGIAVVLGLVAIYAAIQHSRKVGTTI